MEDSGEDRLGDGPRERTQVEAEAVWDFAPQPLAPGHVRPGAATFALYLRH